MLTRCQHMIPGQTRLLVQFTFLQISSSCVLLVYYVHSQYVLRPQLKCVITI